MLSGVDGAQPASMSTAIATRTKLALRSGVRLSGMLGILILY
jgi:hypothetical protein